MVHSKYQCKACSKDLMADLGEDYKNSPRVYRETSRLPASFLCPGTPREPRLTPPSLTSCISVPLTQGNPCPQRWGRNFPTTRSSSKSPIGRTLVLSLKQTSRLACSLCSGVYRLIPRTTSCGPSGCPMSATKSTAEGIGAFIEGLDMCKMKARYILKKGSDTL